MKAYADTSFLLRILVRDAGSAAADSAHRALGRPSLLYSSLHALETSNAIRLRTFLGVNGAVAGTRRQLAREEEAAFRRLRLSLATRRFIAADIPWEEAAKAAMQLSEVHCRRVGLRSFDLLHVAACVEMNCRDFITCDIRQAALAKAAGLKVTLVDADG